MEFLTKIASESSYEALVADMGNVGRRATPMMDMCSAMYISVKDDCVSATKLEEFRAHLETPGKRGLLEEIQKVKLPYHSEFRWRGIYLGQLVWGELGNYVRRFLKGR